MMVIEANGAKMRKQPREKYRKKLLNDEDDACGAQCVKGSKKEWLRMAVGAVASEKLCIS